MSKTDKLNVVLFALTGFGNTVLNALLQEPRVNVRAVFTVKYDNPFPYYPEQPLFDLCAERGIVCYHGLKVSSEQGIAALQQHAPELIIVSTFKQILRANVIAIPRLGVVNFHPSLLPAYRGPCPTNAALLHDDPVTGITIHYITEKLDEGNLLLQRSLRIDRADNDGQLRRKLADLAGDMIPELVDLLFANAEPPVGMVQDHELATFAPKPTAQDGYLDAGLDCETIRLKLRALNPLPGTSFLVGDCRVPVDRFELLPADKPRGMYVDDTVIDIVDDSRTIRLYKKVSG